MKDKVTQREFYYNLKGTDQNSKMTDWDLYSLTLECVVGNVSGLIGRTGHEFANRKGIKAATLS